ncbi:Ecm39 mannosyltransferase [Candida orthopsilosis Co 90-125]|uniref:Mannosyltransferase n=1 Tax=Candida orthopsilosis (strain 90-125) TaxID=1136231 RepID=H8XAD8_CANO9|nr:Ecm39 mannosyltransferase [Candida orthopsilosis Co 90-125]CCG25115.1 Ecm39 mannosyltransferase [Candida orthopsilosis Co 90-125]
MPRHEFSKTKTRISILTVLSIDSSMKRFNKLLDAALIALVTYHLVISPYTKVEESFNIQAIHDILNYGAFCTETIEKYDHKQFPGAVPRSFIGSLVLALLAKPVIFISSIFGKDLLQGEQTQLQTIVRGILGLTNALSLIRLRDQLNKVTFRDKKSNIKGFTGFWYSVLLLSQFHLIYYSSRTLPNFIALPLVNFGLSKLIVGDLSGLTWLAMTGVVFRMEVGVFAVVIAVVSSLVYGQSNIVANIVLLFAGGLFGTLTTLFIDSYFWGKPLVPELSSFIFNIVDGNAAEWGVEPWGAYFNKYLFKLFRPPVVLILSVIGFLNDPADDGVAITDTKAVRHPARNSLRILYTSSIIFIAIMSFQPHKEWRFIIYTIPIFTLQAANGLSNISIKWSLSFSNKLLTLIISFLVLVSALLSLQMGYISSFNYPGGEALEFANYYVSEHYSGRNVTLHIDVPACMTGITRFGELHREGVKYDKSETDVDYDTFDLVITRDLVHGWKLLHKAKIFKNLDLTTILKLIETQKADRSTLFVLLKIMVDEFFNGSNQTLKSLLQSTIALEDYIYVYEQPIKSEESVQEGIR